MGAPDVGLSFLNALGARWWALVLRGVAAVAFGVLAIAMPRDSLIVLIYLFGFYAIADGVFNFITAVQRGRMGVRWGWWLFEGLLSIGAGVITFAWPGITAIMLLYVIAFWALFTGVSEIGAALRIRHESGLLLGFAGVLSILFGVLLLLRPAAGALAVVWMIGFYAIFFGALLIGLGVRLRRFSGAGEEPAPTGGVPRYA